MHFKLKSSKGHYNNKVSITFSIPVKKERDDGKTIEYKLRFIDSFRFMSTSLSELVDNMSGKFNSTECKSCTENNRYEESEKKKKKRKI